MSQEISLLLEIYKKYNAHDYVNYIRANYYFGLTEFDLL